MENMHINFLLLFTIIYFVLFCFHFQRSYRFEHNFTDRNGVTKMQHELEKIISRAVVTNMKYSSNKNIDHNADKNSGYFISRRKKRRKRK